MFLGQFWNALAVILLVFVFLALPYAATETFELNAGPMVFWFYIVLAIFSVIVLMITLIKHKLCNCGSYLKINKRSVTLEQEGSKKDSTYFRYMQTTRSFDFYHHYLTDFGEQGKVGDA
jgi:hypothetical protein